MLQAELALPEGCYTVTQFATAEHPITVSPGTTITFAAGAALAIDANGSLEAIGTAEKPIVLRGRDGTAGSWRGLTISSNSAHNRLSYVTVEDAGVAGKDSAAITLATGAQLGMDHTTVRRSLGNGILLLDRAVFSRFEANRFANTDTPLKIKATDAGMIDGATTFANNKNNVVVIGFGAGKMTEDGLWHKLAVPYRVEGSLEVTAQLTLEAGAQLQFAEGTWLSVNLNGALTAVGTAEAPIVFTGTDQTVGYWGGILFASESAKNVLRHVELRYGGSKSGPVSGGVEIINGASATVASSTIASCPVGIVVARGGRANADLAQVNTFRDDGQTVVMEP